MTTSGTINGTTINVESIITKGIRRCGLLPGSLGSELMIEARDELFLGLSALVNDGAPLWTVTKQIYGLHLNQNLLQFTTGTLDIQNMLYRFNVLPSNGIASSSAGGNAQSAFDQDLATFCTQNAPNGNISYNFGSAVVITTVGMLMHTTQSLNVVYEYSLDGATWVYAVPAALQVQSFEASQWYWQDVAQPVSAPYFRIRETSGGTLDLTELVFGQPAREITISRTNKDDYQNLPNKNSTGRPLQYWFDRQIVPQAWLWPASSYSFNTLVVWRRREIQDVGSFTDTLEFPNRWLDYVISDCAARLSLIMPKVDPARIPVLQAAAMTAKQRVWNEERDNSSVFYAPNLSPYTRGT